MKITLFSRALLHSIGVCIVLFLSRNVEAQSSSQISKSNPATYQIQTGDFPLSTSSMAPSYIKLPDGWKFSQIEALGDLFLQGVGVQDSQENAERPTIVGMIFPKGVDPKPFVRSNSPFGLLLNSRIIVPFDFAKWDSKSWLMIVTFENKGHISDSLAAGWKSEDLLIQAQKTLLENTEELSLAGIADLKFQKWAKAPGWNAYKHTVSWIKQLEVPGKQTWLYGTSYVLTATGALGLHAVAHTNQLELVEKGMMSLRQGVAGLTVYDSKAFGNDVATYNVTDLAVGQSLTALSVQPKSFPASLVASLTGLLISSSIVLFVYLRRRRT
jgi:hypothetical protein